jgi:hypothetical protein
MPVDATMRGDFPDLPNLDDLIDGNGEVTIGAIAHVDCAAVATDEDQCLAMLVRRENETLEELLVRLDRAIEMAYEEEIFIDEVNNGPDERS